MPIFTGGCNMAKQDEYRHGRRSKRESEPLPPASFRWLFNEGDSVMEDQSIFEPTRAPQLNEVILLAKGISEGTADEREFKGSLKELNSFRRLLRRVLKSEVKFYEKSPVLDREVPAMEKALDRLKKGTEEVYRYFSDREKTHIAEGLKICRKSFEAFFSSIDALNESEKGVTYSDSPYQNELMRVGYGVLKGTLKPHALKERLDEMLGMVKAFCQNFDSLEPSAPEREIFLEKRHSIKSALHRYQKSLHEVSRYFDDHDMCHIEKGLKASMEAADALMELQRELIKVSEGPRSKLCFRCGKENEIIAKYCVHCNASFPSYEMGEKTSMEFRMDTCGQVEAVSHARTELSLKLIDGVSKVREGSISREHFERLLNEMEQKALHARKEKGRLRLPGEIREAGETSDREFFEAMEELMVGGIEDIVEGLGRMKLYASGSDETSLTIGLERALNGADKLSHVQRLTEQLKASG
jgi:hypothetical protein